MSGLKREKQGQQEYFLFKKRIMALQTELKHWETVLKSMKTRLELMQDCKGSHAGFSADAIRTSLRVLIAAIKKSCKQHSSIIEKSNNTTTDWKSLDSELEILNFVPMKRVRLMYQQTDAYLKHRDNYIQSLKKIALEFNQYLDVVRRDEALKHNLQARKVILSGKNMTEGYMWSTILQNTDEDVLLSFQDLADYEPLIPLTVLTRELQLFKQTIQAAKKGQHEEVISLKSYSALTLEELRQNYVDGIKFQLDDIKRFLYDSNEVSELLASARNFYKEQNSWWGWIPVFVFDFFNISDEYRPLEAKSIDALYQIQQISTALHEAVKQCQTAVTSTGSTAEAPDTFTQCYFQERVLLKNNSVPFFRPEEAFKKVTSDLASKFAP